MKTLLRIGIVVLSVLVSPAAFAQDKGAHPAPAPPPSNPVHAAPAPAPPPPPPAVHSAPAPQATHVAPPPPMRSAPSADRAVPRDGATPRGAMRDPSLSDSAAAASGPSRGGGHGAAPSGSPSGARATPRTDSAGTTRTAAPRNDRGRTAERAVPNGERSRGDRPSYGTAVARTHPPHHPGGGGGYHPSYPWYAPWYPYSFGLFYWDPFWWGSTYSPYGYDSGYAYGYDSGGGSSSADYGTGSLKLKVKPNDAQVYVDGYFAGLVDDYDGMLQKLNLEVGPHHIEIRAPGYETLSFDIQIQLDETITYRGELTKSLQR